MAFSAKDLSVLAYANGFTLWHYTTADTPADVRAAGYFSGASDLLRAGDMILVNCGGGGGVLLVTTSGFQQGVAVSPLGFTEETTVMAAAPSEHVLNLSAAE